MAGRSLAGTYTCGLYILDGTRAVSATLQALISCRYLVRESTQLRSRVLHCFSTCFEATSVLEDECVCLTAGAGVCFVGNSRQVGAFEFALRFGVRCWCDVSGKLTETALGIAAHGGVHASATQQASGHVRDEVSFQHR